MSISGVRSSTVVGLTESCPVAEVFTLIVLQGEAIDTSLSCFLAAASKTTATAITLAARHWWAMLSNQSNLLVLRFLISHFSCNLTVTVNVSVISMEYYRIYGVA